MAKLPKEILEEGRSYIERGEMKSFYIWADMHTPLIDKKLLQKTLEKALKVGDTDRVLRLFDGAVATYDTSEYRRDAIKLIFKIMWRLAVFAAVIGGCIYLYNVITQ